MRKAIPQRIRLLVAKRANFRCEYCMIYEEDMFLSFEIDHIISIKHGGDNQIENLAFSCPHCNQNKGSDLATFVDDYDNIVLLFNPRKHKWSEHFSVDFGEIRGLSDIGKGTVKLLKFNENVDLIILRRLLIQSGRYP